MYQRFVFKLQINSNENCQEREIKQLMLFHINSKLVIKKRIWSIEALKLDLTKLLFDFLPCTLCRLKKFCI